MTSTLYPERTNKFKEAEKEDDSMVNRCEQVERHNNALLSVPLSKKLDFLSKP